MINISIVGSTGSIGTQALDVIRCFPDKFSVVAFSANSNWELLLKQIIEFKPLKAVLIDNIAFSKLKENAPNDLNTELICGESGIKEISSMDETELVLISTVGMSGLKPVLSALNAGKQLALATKEALVSGGDLVIPLAKSKNITIRPVDSEHSAIFQCIGDNREFLKKVILTCSGGALRNFTVEQLKYATVDDIKKLGYSVGCSFREFFAGDIVKDEQGLYKFEYYSLKHSRGIRTDISVSYDEMRAVILSLALCELLDINVYAVIRSLYQHFSKDVYK